MQSWHIPLMKLLPLLIVVIGCGCSAKNSGDIPSGTTINNLSDIPIGTSLTAFRAQATKIGCEQVWNSGPQGDENYVFSCKPGGNYITNWDSEMKLKSVKKVVK